MASSSRSLRSRVAVKSELEISAEKPSDKLNSKLKSPKKRKGTKASNSKTESGVKVKNLDGSATETKQIKLEVPSNSETESDAKVKNSKQSAPKTKQIKQKVPSYSKTESVVKVENSDETKHIKLEVPEMNVSVSPKKNRSPRKIKTETSNFAADIENGGWEPPNWKEVYENILQMRKLHVAPVDSLGCEECPEKDIPPEVFRYQTLISVMLSSQTRDQVTFAASQRLIDHGLTIDNILKTSDEKIGELIYPAGFWKSKVQFIKKTSQILKDQYNSDVPRTLKELCKLPGVGPKMANIVMSVAWKETVGIAVDTHVHRISNRLGWVPEPTKNPEQTRKALQSWLPKELWDPINITLVGFGQTICKPIGPSCGSCLNNKLCPFEKSNSPSKKKNTK